MIRIKCTLHALPKEPADQAHTLEQVFDNLPDALGFYTRARAADLEPVVVEGREHFPQLPEVRA